MIVHICVIPQNSVCVWIEFNDYPATAAYFFGANLVTPVQFLFFVLFLTSGQLVRADIKSLPGLELSRPGCQNQVIRLLFTCQTAELLLAFHDLISSFLPIVVARCFLTFPAPSLSFLSLPSPSGTFHSRLLTVLSASGSFCTLLMCSC
jgi:hypothetical protein